MATMLGAYRVHGTIEELDKAVFEQVSRGLLGVHYELLAVATQVVNGTNYKFLCKAAAVYPEARLSLVFMDVKCKFSHGRPPQIELEGITDVLPEERLGNNAVNILGGWTIPGKLENVNLPQALASGFAKVCMDYFEGVSLVPVLYCGKQVVSGINHMLVCTRQNPDEKEPSGVGKLVVNIPEGDVSGAKATLVSEQWFFGEGNGFIADMQTCCGGYTLHDEVQEMDRWILSEVTGKGMSYRILATAAQIVNGTNYHFYCISNPVILHPVYSLVQVDVCCKFAHSTAPVIKLNGITNLLTGETVV